MLFADFIHLFPLLQHRGRSGRVLESGNDVKDFGVRGLQDGLLKLIRIDACVVVGKRYAHGLRSAGTERVQGADKGRCFHQNRISFVAHDLAEQFNALLSARHHDGRVEIPADAPDFLLPLGNGFAQRRISVRHAVLQRGRGGRGKNIRRQAGQILHRERLRRRVPCRERNGLCVRRSLENLPNGGGLQIGNFIRKAIFHLEPRFF